MARPPDSPVHPSLLQAQPQRLLHESCFEKGLKAVPGWRRGGWVEQRSRPHRPSSLTAPSQRLLLPKVLRASDPPSVVPKDAAPEAAPPEAP
eukprot:197887-Chlamydomonas_euryale.AAC.6